MGNNKAPGPDGMSVLFFKHYWGTVGEDFSEVVLDFFWTGIMHKGVNATNIVLIPKVQNPKRTNHYRHISLCNVLYKVISKIIANRIKPPLPFLICPTQAAFVPGRNIQDNNVIIQEIIHSFNRKKGKEGCFAIKIDLMKAYDKLGWNFVDHVLAGFGAPQKFQGWISQCITTTSLNICLNGGQFGNITPSCGIRQGDPLGGPILSHIFFVDHFILVGRANLEEAKSYWQCIERQKDADFNFIIENLISKLQGWKAKSLSKAGRATLIKSVGLSLPMYAMQTTKLSSRLVTKIDGMVRDFWWGSEKGNHGLYLKAWDKLFLPKSLRGLGFRACKLVVDEKDTNIWNYPWIAHRKGFLPRSDDSSTVGVTKVADLLLDNGGWNIPLLNSAFDKGTVSDILKGGNPSGLASDIWISTLEGNGRFSNKSAYLAQALDRVPLCEAALSLWNRLWNSKISERLKTLCWCILAKALPVRSVIDRKFPIEEVSCPLYGIENETIKHLFLSCNVTFHLWRSSPWGIFPVCDTGIRMWDWVKFIWDLKNKGINSDEVFLYASLTVDTIWRIMNDKVHNNCLFDVTKCIDSIRSSFTVHHASVFPCSTPCLMDD
ncbi:hypothetical protein CsatB_017355 [Cannabis sativa]